MKTKEEIRLYRREYYRKNREYYKKRYEKLHGKKKTKMYAMYSLDDFEFMGTKEEVCERYNIKYSTLRFYCSKRCRDDIEKNGKRKRYAIILEDDEEDF